jgi:hypothetical protein
MCHSLSQVLSTSTVINGYFFHEGLLFCEDTISQSVVHNLKTVKGHSYLKLHLTIGKGAMNKWLYSFSGIYPQALPAWRQQPFELWH